MATWSGDRDMQKRSELQRISASSLKNHREETEIIAVSCNYKEVLRAKCRQNSKQALTSTKQGV